MATPLMVDATEEPSTAAQPRQYGTIATFRIKPGAEQALARMAEERETAPEPPPAGFVAQYIYELSREEHRYAMVVVFASEADYHANAASPEQHARYLQFREHLIDDPDWQDGPIVLASTVR